MPSKITAIQDAPRPSNVSQLRSFLGLGNYYSRFLPNLSTTLHPLNDLLQKGKSWNWTSACNDAFTTIKENIRNCRSG